MKHYLNHCPLPEWVHYLLYLNPHPKELMLTDMWPSRAQIRVAFQPVQVMSAGVSVRIFVLNESLNRHNTPTGHLPQIPNAGTMYSAIGSRTTTMVAYQENAGG